MGAGGSALSKNVSEASPNDITQALGALPDSEKAKIASAVIMMGQGSRNPAPADIDQYGRHLFKGAVADKYLQGQGAAPGLLNDGSWTKDMEKADKVAAAIVEWARANGAKNYCHWFQPMGANGVRHGQTGQVHNAIFKFDEEGRPVWDLSGKDLLQSETDGSSYPNGGLRATHTAAAYLSIDPTSPIFLRGDTIFIPATFVSYHGHALDEKTPLLRSADALNKEGTRLLKLLGYNVSIVESKIGLEQEFFLIPREHYKRRPDLQLTGRTIIGRDAPRGQEMSDHYMAPLSHYNPALECIKEMQECCYQMGIPMRTRHREVAPNQYEMAPLFGTVTTQIDQNLVVLQVMEEVAAKHGLACLVQEKPFNNVNGSGKHNNWSVGTDGGVNLMNCRQVTEASGNPDIFPLVIAAVVHGVEKHGDLLRCAIADPGNDFRLGACEAPPAILSTYLGESLTTALDDYRKGNKLSYSPQGEALNLGASCLLPLQRPAEDRNRTSPFPYGGHRFEFRAVGSAQNVSLVNTVLNVITAESFKLFADAIEGGKKPQDVAAEALNASWKVIFNGNGYDLANQKELTDRGVWRIDSGVEAMSRLSAEKNIKLFESSGVLTKDECHAKMETMFDHYTGLIEMEAGCFIDMLNGHVIPSVKKAGNARLADCEAAVATLKKALAEIHGADSSHKKAELARVLRLETMVKLREGVDAAEAEVPAEMWTLATYKELLFLDQH
eukprot:TRINITY_DN2928_c0_g1_i1.p1 TRINITY_DN2928_c0_g1~~TRINITY_DN2928_c0_g1_i1.p1  ORF type:complete len:725 (-),score=193.65 TRINITY_DN2928_c0_g1_i1:304-2478(-)